MNARLRAVMLAGASFGLTLALFFAPAWTFDYWQAWVYLSVVTLASAAIAGYLRSNDPNLLKRRARGPTAESNAGQRLLHVFTMLIFAAAVVLSSFDHRFGWSQVPLPAVLAGDALAAFGLLIYFVVFRVNTYAGAAIEVLTDQRVIVTGPYAVVRHPMYAGLLILLLGTPPALGSWWGLLMLVPMAVVLRSRIRYEERFLTANLRGYADFCGRIRYRLFPRVW